MIRKDSVQNQRHIKHFTSQMIKGFSFLIPNGTIITEYPRLGVILILKNCLRFFDGETMEQVYKGENQIAVMSLKDEILVIGEKMFKGQLTNTIILNLKTKAIKIYKYQKTKMQSLTVSKNKDYLCSVGSSDTVRQQLFIINIAEDEEYGFKAILEEKYEHKDKNKIVMVQFAEQDNNLLAILFLNRLVLGRIENDKFVKKQAKANKVRQFSMVIFDPYDINCLACSKNGDISEILIKQNKQVRLGPRKRVIIAGIKHIRFVKPNRLIITGVKGFMALLDLKQLKILKQVTIEQEIVSLTEFIGDLGFVTTKMGNIFVLDAETLNINQFYTCHNSKINSLTFASGFNEVFGSCAGSQIIIWKTSNMDPLLKIRLPNKICLCILFPHDGKAIISGWNDDCIRFFNPVTGKQINKISKANNSQVSALIITQDLDQLISGGQNGSIRIWRIDKQKFGIIQHLFIGHKGKIHNFSIQKSILYSASEDGSFGIWDLQKKQKLNIVYVSNFLKQVLPFDEFSVICIGSGSKMFILRKNDGKLLKQIQLQGSHINTIDKIILQQSVFYIYGGEANKVIAQKYISQDLTDLESTQYLQTYGEIMKIKISTDQSTLIIGTIDGTLLLYKFEQMGIAEDFRKGKQFLSDFIRNTFKNK